MKSSLIRAEVIINNSSFYYILIPNEIYYMTMLEIYLILEKDEYWH